MFYLPALLLAIILIAVLLKPPGSAVVKPSDDEKKVGPGEFRCTLCGYVFSQDEADCPNCGQ